MNELLQKELLSLIEVTKEASGTILGFAQTEIPIVLKQLLLWHGAKSFILFVFGLVLFAVAVYTTKYYKPLYVQYNRCEGDVYMMALVFLGVAHAGLFFAGICIVFNNLAWVQILIAPKLYLLECALTIGGVK